jgi:phosphoribosylaminoimidazole (AIR) synthetase
MYLTFNMGTGFCVICAEDTVEAVVAICKEHEVEAQAIGVAVEEPGKQVAIEGEGLVGRDGEFVKV